MPTLVIATVEGDIHDIGKNLVVLMLKNYLSSAGRASALQAEGHRFEPYCGGLILKFLKLLTIRADIIWRDSSVG